MPDRVRVVPVDAQFRMQVDASGAGGGANGGTQGRGGRINAVLATTPLVGAAGQAIHAGTNWSPKQMFGVGIDYPTVRSWRVSRGGFFSERDVAGAEKVCVVGHTVAARLL